MSDTNKQVGFTFTVEANRALDAIEAMHKASDNLGKGMLQVASVTTGALKSTEQGVADLETVTIKMVGTVNKNMKQLSTELQQVDASFKASFGPQNLAVIDKLGDSFLTYSTKVVKAQKSIDETVTGSMRAKVNSEKQAHEASVQQYKQTVDEFKRAEDIKINESGTAANKIKAIKQKQADELIAIERELTQKIIAEQQKIESYYERLSNAQGRSAGGYRGLITQANNRINDYVTNAGSSSTNVIQSSTSQIQAIQAAQQNGTSGAAQLQTSLASYRSLLQDHINATRIDINRMLIEARDGFTVTAQQSRTVETSLTGMRSQFRATAAVIRDDLTRGVISLTEAEQHLNNAQQEWLRSAQATTQELRNSLEAGRGGIGDLLSFIGQLNLAWRATNFAIDTVINALKSIPNALIEAQASFSALEGSFTINPADPAGMNSLSFAAVAAGESMKYLRNESQRTGIPLSTLEGNYRSFLASTRISGESLSTTNKIFQDMNTTITALHLSADNASNVLLALSQIFNKGKVQSEELVKQLGNLLPGAFAAFAESTGRSTEQLVADMKKGLVRSHEELEKFSAFYAKYYTQSFETAKEGLNYNLGVLKTDWENAARGIGFALDGLLVKLTQVGQSFLKALTPDPDALSSLDKFFIKLNIAPANAKSFVGNKQIEYINEQLKFANREKTNPEGTFGLPHYADEVERLAVINKLKAERTQIEKELAAFENQKAIASKRNEGDEKIYHDLKDRYYKKEIDYATKLEELYHLRATGGLKDEVEFNKILNGIHDEFLPKLQKQDQLEAKLNERLDKQIEKRNTLLEQVRSEREKFDASQSANAVAAGIQPGITAFEAADKIKSNLQEMKSIFDSLNLSEAEFNKNLSETATNSAAVAVNLSGVAKGDHFSQTKFDGALKAINNPANREMINLIERVAEQTKFDPDILKAVAAVESGFKANADSGKALGLFQFTPSTAAGYGVSDRLNPEQSTFGAVKYLSENLNNFKGDLAKALNQYNGGGKTGLNKNAESLTYQDTLLPLIKYLKEAKGATLEFSQSVDTSTASAGLNNQKLEEGIKKINHLKSENEVLSTVVKAGTENLRQLKLPDWLNETKATTLFDANEQFREMGSKAIPKVAEKLREVREATVENAKQQLAAQIELDNATKARPYSITQGGAANEANEARIKTATERLNALKLVEDDLKGTYQGATTALKNYNNEFKDGSKVVKEYEKDLSRQMKQAGKNDEELYIEGFREKLINEHFIDGDQVAAEVEKIRAKYAELQVTIQNAKLKEFLKDTFSSAFKDIITGAKSLGDTLKTVFENFTTEIVNTSLNHLVNNFQKGFSAVASDLIQLTAVAIYSIFKETPKTVTQSAAQQVHTAGSGAQSIADVSGRQLAYDASLPSIAEFNRNLSGATNTLKGIATNLVAESGIGQSIGKSVGELVGESLSKFIGLGGNASTVTSATYKGFGQLGGLEFKPASEAVSGLGTVAAKASGYLAIATLGFDLFNIASQKGVKTVDQFSQGLSAGSSAAVGLSLAAQSLGGSFLGASAGAFAFAGAALQGVSLITDVVSNGFTKTNVGGLAAGAVGAAFFGPIGFAIGALIGKLLGGLLERKPNAWLNSFASDRGTALTDKREQLDGGLWLRDTNKGGFIGIQTAFGDLELSVHEIAKFNKNDLVESYKPWLQTMAAYDNALGRSIESVDKLYGEDTLGKYKSMLWDGTSGTRIAFKQDLKNLNTAGLTSDYNSGQADLLGKVNTVAGRAYNLWYDAFNKAWIENATGVAKDYAQTTSLSIKSILIGNLSEFVGLPKEYADIFANSVKSVASGASLTEAQASAKDLFTGWSIASNAFSASIPDLIGTKIPEYLGGLAKIGANVTEGAAQLVNLGNLLGAANFGKVFESYYTQLKSKGYTDKEVAGATQTAALVGGVAKDLGFDIAKVGIDAYSLSILEQAKVSTQAANDEINQAVAAAKATDEFKGSSNEAIKSHLILSGKIQQSTVDAADLAKAQKPLQQAFLDSLAVSDQIVRTLGLSVNTVAGNFGILEAVGSNLIKAFGDAKTASETFQGALRALFSPNQLAIMGADSQSVLVDRQISNLGLKVDQETFRNYGTALFSNGNLNQLLDKSGTKINFQGQQFDFAAALRAWQSLGVLDQLKAEAAKAPVGGSISPGELSNKNQTVIDTLKSNPSYEAPTTKDTNAAETAAKNLSKFNEELNKTINLIGKTDVSKGLAEVSNYILDYQQKAIEAGATITGDQLIALTRGKMQETFQGVVDEYKGLHQTSYQKAIEDATKFRTEWLAAADEVALKTGYTAEQIKAYANEIADARIAKEVNAINASVAELGKNAAKLQNSDLGNTLYDLTDKYLTAINNLTQNKDATLAQYQSLVDDLKVEGGKAAADARSTVIKQYESIFQAIIDKSRTIDLDIRDKQLNSYKLTQTALLQGDLNSTNLDTRISAQKKLATLSKDVAAYQLESLMIQQRAAAESYNKPFNSELETKQDYVNRQLKAIDTLQSLSDQFYTLQIDNAKVLVDLVNQANEKVRQLLVNPTLSVLTPLQQMEEAGRQFQTALELAQSGDAESAQKVTGYADTYLNLAKTYYASTQGYSNIFKTVTDGLSGLNVKLADPQTSIATNTATTVSYLNDIKGLIANTNQIALAQKGEALIGIQTSINTSIDRFTAQLQVIADKFGDFATVDRTTGTLSVINKQQAYIDTLKAQQQQTLTAQLASDGIRLNTALAALQASQGVVKQAVTTLVADPLRGLSTPGIDAFLSGNKDAAYAAAAASGKFTPEEIAGFRGLAPADQLTVINQLKAQGRTFAKGGQTPDGWVMVGETGPEMMKLNSPSYVTSKSDTERMFDNSQVVSAILESTQQIVASNDANIAELVAYQRETVVKMTQMERRLSAIESNGALVKAG